MKKSNNKDYIPHDALYKDLFGSLFLDAIEYLLPELHSMLDDNPKTKLLSQEIILKNHKKRYVDLLVETRLQSKRVLFHIEFQSSRVSYYNEKMLDYCWEIYKKHRCIVISIVLYTHDSQVEEKDYFKIEIDFLRTLYFKFYSFQLKTYYWRDYIEGSNPITAALISNMSYEENEKVDMKMESIRILEENDLDEVTKGMIIYFFDRYVILNSAEKAILKKRIRKNMVREEWKNIWEIG